MSPYYIRSREGEPMQRVISKPKSNSKPYRKNKQNIDNLEFPASENNKAF